MPIYKVDFPRVPYAPGLEATQTPGKYAPMYTFPALSEDAGWTTIRHKSRHKNRKQ